MKRAVSSRSFYDDTIPRRVDGIYLFTLFKQPHLQATKTCRVAGHFTACLAVRKHDLSSLSQQSGADLIVSLRAKRSHVFSLSG